MAWYRTGTLTVTNGSTAVSGVLTAWSSNVRAGDFLFVGTAAPVEIAAVNSNTSITLAEAWPGGTGSSASYAIAQGTAWGDVTALAVQIAQLISSRTEILSGTGVPSNSLGSDGSVYFRIDQPEYYSKAAGAWGTAISLRGPAGTTGAGFSIASTTSAAIGIGSKTFAIASDGLSYIGARARIASASLPANYMEGVVQPSSTATSLVVTVDRVGGSGTFASWKIITTGDPGSQGPAGSPSTGASSSPVAIGTGLKTFTVPSGLDLVTGQRVRFADTADPAGKWMDGAITSYIGTSMSINVPADGISTSGTGTVSSWTFGLAGARGLTGPQGEQGLPGDPGATGASYAATSTTSLAIGTGNKDFVTQAGLAYVVNASRARAADSTNPANYIEGPVTSYSGTALRIAADRIGGSGTIASWNISLAGEPGADGAPGAPGADGDGAVNSVNDVLSVGGNVVLTAADIPSAASAVNYTAATADIDAHLTGIDTTLGAVVASAAASALPTPQGRLTLSAGVPVLSDDVTAATNIYYSPLIGDLVPIFDGTSWVSKSIILSTTDTTGLILALDADSGHTGYHQSSKVFDVFVGLLSGTMYFGTAAAWTSVTARGTGSGTTELEMLSGKWVNKNAINLRHGPASANIVTIPARQATYLGSIITSADGQTEMTFKPTPAAGGTNNKLYVWNAYNQVPMMAVCRDNTNTWAYSTATIRRANYSSANRVSFCLGLGGGRLSGRYSTYVSWASSSGAIVGVGYDSTTAFMEECSPCFLDEPSAIDAAPMVSHFDRQTSDIGYHYVQGLEWANAAGVTFFGDNALPALIQTGLSVTVYG